MPWLGAAALQRLGPGSACGKAAAAATVVVVVAAVGGGHGMCGGI